MLICSPVDDEYVTSKFKREVLSEQWEHVRGADVDPTLNPIKQMAVTISGDHGAVFIDIWTACAVDECDDAKSIVGNAVGFAFATTGQCGAKDSSQLNSVATGAVFWNFKWHVRRIALQPARQQAARG